MDELETTNPVDDADASEAEVENEVQDEPQLDEHGNPIEDDAEEVEEEDELDIDGFKLKLPKSKAEKLNAERLMQADYTRKTQAHAEEVKAFEAKRQADAQADENELEARGTLRALSNQIARYENIDWTTWQQQAAATDAQNFDNAATAQFNAEWLKYQQFKDAKDKTTAYLGNLSHERRSKEQQDEAKARDDFAKLTEEGTPAIKKAIPDWGRATAAKLFEDSAKTYNLTREEISGAGEREILILSDAAKWRQHQAKTKTAQTAQAQTELKPAAKIGGAAPKTGLDDRLSGEEWQRRRNAQLAKRA